MVYGSYAELLIFLPDLYPSFPNILTPLLSDSYLIFIQDFKGSYTVCITIHNIFSQFQSDSYLVLIQDFKGLYTVCITIHNTFSRF